MPIASNPNQPLVRSARVSIELSDSSRSPFTCTITATVNPAQLDYDYLLACSGPNEQTAAVIRPEGIWHKEAAAASFVRYSLPAQIPQGSKAVAVQKLRSMIVFLLDNGQLWYGLDGQAYYKLSDNCWEFDSAEFRDGAAWGPTYMPKNLITISPDGHVIAQDNAVTGGLDAPLVNAVMVQRQRYFSAVLTNDGHVHCWGKNDVYQCGANYAAAAITDPAAVPKVSNVGHIAITKNDGYGATFVMAATLDGKVWVWGNDMGASGVSNRDISQGPVQVGGFVPGTKIVKVYCGYSHGEAFGIDDKGNLWSWGKSNGQGTLGRNNAPAGSVAAPGLWRYQTARKC